MTMAIMIFCALGPSLMAADITGAWYFERTAANGRKTEGYYVFRAGGNQFTGRSITTSNRQEIVNGVVNGDQITFEVKNWQPTGKPTAYKGTLNGDELRFTQAQVAQGRQPQETVLKRVTTSPEFSPPPSLAAPLLAGNDLRSTTRETIEILTNKEVIAIDQDKLGKQGTRVKQEGELEIWKKPLADGVAVALFNRSAAAAQMTVRWADLGIKKNPKVRDLWAHTDLKAPDEFSAEVAPHGVVMLRVK